jgi:hypothetical protein
MQNIFQQVFASANATHEFKVKVKIKPPVTIAADPGAPASEMVIQIPARGRKKSQRASKDFMELQSEMETRLQQMVGQLKQNKTSLAKIREHNLILEKWNSDLENLIERLRQAATTTALQTNEI